MENTYSITPKFKGMCLDKKKSLQTIKSRIALPHEWLLKTDDTIAIKYYIDGHLKFLTIARDKVLPLLKQYGLITKYEGSGKNRKMYNCHVPAGVTAFTSDWQESQVQCEDLKVYPSDVIDLIARSEHDKLVNLMKYYQMN